MRRAFLAVIVFFWSVVFWGLAADAQILLKPLTPPGGTARMGGSVFPPQGNPQTAPVQQSSREVLSSYRAFSRDGRFYAFGETPPGRESAQLYFKAVNPEDTPPQTLPLTTEAEQQQALTQLKNLGFPRPGEAGGVPPDLSSTLQGNRVAVTMRGMPVDQPFRPFEEEPNVQALRTSIVAASRDGQYVAVRTLGEDPSGAPVMPEHDIVNLLARAPKVPRAGPQAPPEGAP